MTPSPDDAWPRRKLEEALAHHRAGRLDLASAIYQEILRQAPDDADALYYSGLVLLGRGDPAEAVRRMGRAAAALEKNADFNANFGLALRAAGWHEQAKARFRRALEANPKHGIALYNLGLLLGGERDWAGAAAIFRLLAEKNPDSAEPAHLLGRALAGDGRIEAARERHAQAIRLDPGLLDARLDLAELELAEGRPEAAEAVLAEVAARATNLNAPVLMAEIRARAGDGAGREKWLARAKEVEPDAAKTFFEAGAEMQAANMTNPAEKLFRRALTVAPGHPGALWALKRLLPTIYDCDAEIAPARRRYETGLGVLEAALAEATDAARLRPAFLAMTRHINFYLAYQEGDDRALQERHGRLAARVMNRMFPQFAAAPAMPDPEPDGRLRVGIFTRFFHMHTVSRLYAGWFEKLDRRRFRLFGYHASATTDPVHHMLAGRCEVFRPLGRDILAAEARPFADRIGDLCRVVANDRLHVLLFPEIGMDPTTYYVAALRLAPVQAAGIGHPVTTGLATMDYFLSGELIEPEGAETHYSETLVRLPNISIRLFDAGSAPRPGGRTRADFGFGADEIVYLSPQSLMKYLPRYDRIFPAIARAVPNARFVFIRPGRMEQEGIFLSRLRRAFAAEGLERDHYCRFFDYLPAGEFGDLNAAADVFLDTPGWSGGNTTHEAIAAGLPIVTLPGLFMRGRVSAGMLRMIGVEGTIAREVDDYIAIAVRLGREPEFRARMRAEIEANRAKLYHDEACVRGLEEFIVRAVAEKGSPG